MPRKHYFKIENATDGQPVKVTIEGNIGDWQNSSQQFRDAFSRIGKNENVALHIASGGGSIFHGNEIANIIRDHAGNVNVTLGSICASIATVIACAGDTVKAAKNTVYMVHNPSTYSEGDAREFQKTADILNLLKGTITQAYADKTGMSEDEVGEMMDDETWMNAKQAKESGFVDEIAEEDADDEIIDSIDLSNYQNISSFIERLGDAGNLSPRVVNAALKIAASAPTIPPKPKPKEEPENMTAEEIAAKEKKEKEAIKAAIQAVLKARAERDKEIRALVVKVKDRDKKDFTALAEEYLGRPDETEADCAASLGAFKDALIHSDKFNRTEEIVGSGIEMTEPADIYRGSAGHAFICSAEFRALQDQIKKGGGGTHIEGLRMSVTLPMNRFRNQQTSTATSGAGLTSIEKLPGVVQLGVRPLTIEDLISPGFTTATDVRYIQEVTFTEAADAVAEIGELPEITVTYTEEDAFVRDIGGYVKMSENLMADYAGVASFINQRLPYQVDRAVDDQLLVGNGTNNRLVGMLETGGIQTLALANVPGGSRLDLLLKLQTLVRWQNMAPGQAQGGFEPDAYIIHPTDWETFMLAKDANNQYYYRGPFTGAYGQDGENVKFYEIWGLPVAVSPVIPQGTVGCGAFRMAAQKFDRQGLTIEMTNCGNDGDFMKRLITVRGVRRLALAVYRPGSICTGTGL